MVTILIKELNTEGAFKINRTKYSGLTLQALTFLIGLDIPVDRNKVIEVWTEMFHRYFNEGRQFNLYALILEVGNQDKYVFFTKSIELELVHEKTSIPVEHTEAFIKNLLDFIGFIDTIIISTENLKFEWQLHSLSGLKDMLDKVKKAKVKDNILRQKINLFIDKINMARKETLLHIEEDNSQKAKEEQKLENNELIEYDPWAITPMEVHTALMKQELKHLDIPLSKVNKGQLLEMLEHLNLYYPEDKKKIVKKAVHKYLYEAIKIQPYECFAELFHSKLENVNITDLMSDVFKSYRDIDQDFIDAFVPKGTKQELFDFLEKWLWSIDGMETNLHRRIMLSIYKKRDRKRYEKLLTDLLQTVMKTFKKHKGKKLSDILKEKVIVTAALNKEGPRSGLHNFPVTYNRVKEGWILKTENNEEKSINVLEYYYILESYFSYSLYRYDGCEIQDNKIECLVSKDFMPLIKEFISFPLSITIDPETINDPIVQEYISDSGHYWRDGFKEAMTSFLKHKFCQDKINVKEIKFLYRDHFEFFYMFCGSAWTNSYSGAFRDFDNYMVKYYDEALVFFDFSIPGDLEKFFRFKIKGDTFFGDSKYSYANCILSKDQGKKLVRKLENECPHEVALIAEYFEVKEEVYTDFVEFDEFIDLSPIEKLLLVRNGVEIGEDKKFTGYRETKGEKNTYYTAEELKYKYIIDYFSKMFSHSKQ